METLTNLLSIAEVALGLGFVIFLHELGHFALAKWNGVKVEKFSIGFGPTILGFTRGETEYVLALIPLGGFVKMLGEGPDEEASKSLDPRAYPNKSVGARMAIISAGVIMNLILGFACFVYAYKMGIDEMPTRIGGVAAGSPAYIAGLRDGDQIVSMDGRGDLSFNNLTLHVRLSGHGQVIKFDVKRPGREDPLHFAIEPRREAKADMPSIGIRPGFGLDLLTPPYITPAGVVEPPKDPQIGLKARDRIVAAGPVGTDPQPVSEMLELHRRFASAIDKPFTLVVERQKSESDDDSVPGEKVSTTIPANRFVTFGFRLTADPISAVTEGSPAAKAGFQKGDRIVKVDGHDDFDPMKLPTIVYQSVGKPLTFEVERTATGGSPQNLTLTATPEDVVPWVQYPFDNEPLDVPGLGLAIPVRTLVAAVAPGSPADKAGIKAGDMLGSVTLPAVKIDKLNEKPVDVSFEDTPNAWPTVFREIQLRPLAPIEFTLNKSSKAIEITPVADADWPHLLRGLQFQYLRHRTPAMSVASALRRGLDDTIENILSIYAMVRSLVSGRVSPKQLGGPLMIGDVAFHAAKLGLTELIHFLGILSINLAVLNFLPIPPLDGGQMVFLLAEKVRGRPLPDRALIAGTYLGLLMVLGLMAFVLFQDFARYVTGWF